ncbi:MAG: hypothetical protein K6A92_10175 [Lachnospiraceae bacterium]|nr:hypothetical protein [Lachnospiraceae bacterium]
MRNTQRTNKKWINGIGVTALTLFLCACGAQNQGTVQTEAIPGFAQDEGAGQGGSDEQTAGSEASFGENEEVIDLTEEELGELENLINDRRCNGFLMSSYQDPTNINWNEVFYSGTGFASTMDLDGQEGADVLEALHQAEFYCDVTKVTTGELESFVTEWTGTAYGDAKRPITWTYLSKYDAYYNEHGDTNYLPFKVVSGTKQGDRYTFCCVRDDGFEGVSYDNNFETVVIRQEDGSYRFYSNRLLWEKDSVPEQTFAADLSEYPGNTWFVTYPATDTDGVTMRIICEDEVQDYLYCYGFDEDPITSVDAVAFKDYDHDGNTDILVIGSNSEGAHPMVFDGFDTEDVYLRDFYMNEGLSRGADLYAKDKTVGALLDYLQDGHTEDTFASAQDAYAFAARLFKLSKGEEAEILYDLVYVDGDDIPELVCNHSGYTITLYTFDGARCHTVMKDMGYGVGGNAGYGYLPGKNRLYNGDADYAGMIYYHSFYHIGEDHKLAHDKTYMVLNFDDANHNEYPDEGEDYEESAGGVYLYEETGARKAVDESDCAEDFRDMANCEYFYGTMTYEELLEQLR